MFDIVLLNSILLGICFNIVSSRSKKSSNDLYTILSKSLLYLEFLYLLSFFFDFKGKDNIEKWKEQHLNDPRRKYL